MAQWDLHKNFAYTTVTTPPTPATSGITIIVADGTVFPTVPFNVTIWPADAIPTNSNAEIARVTVVSTNTLTVTRATESTVARAIVAGDQIAETITAKAFTDIEVAITSVVTLTDGATPALDASLGTIFSLTAAGDRTIAVPTNPTSGQKIIIRHIASGASRSLALNTGAGGFRFGSDVTGLSTTVSAKTDYIGAIYNATASFWDVVAYSKGY